jgi:hypothetical protein
MSGSRGDYTGHPLMSSCELHIDAGVLAELFKLDFEHVALRQTLSGRPYIALRVKAPTGAKPGAVLYGKVAHNPNGSIELGWAEA